MVATLLLLIEVKQVLIQTLTVDRLLRLLDLHRKRASSISQQESRIVTQLISVQADVQTVPLRVTALTEHIRRATLLLDRTELTIEATTEATLQKAEAIAQAEEAIAQVSLALEEEEKEETKFKF